MKIILIHQAAADMPWAPPYDAASFDRASKEERQCHAVTANVKKGDASAYRLYIGTAPAAAETAEMLFDYTEPPESTPLLDDAAPRAWRETDKTYPLRRWQSMARLQWRFGGGRQVETRRETMARAGEFVDRLEADGRDSIVISRGWMMEALKSVLRRRGYAIDGGGLLPKPLDRLRAVKQSARCGGCHHNCQLSAPRCDVGRNKAKEKGVSIRE